MEDEGTGTDTMGGYGDQDYNEIDDAVGCGFFETASGIMLELKGVTGEGKTGRSGKMIPATIIFFFCLAFVQGYFCYATCGRTAQDTDVSVVVESNGGRPDWSQSLGVIAHCRYGEDGYYDVWLMNPDGSGARNLTHGNPGISQLHNGLPSWHPSGRYMVFQSQDPSLPHNDMLDYYFTQPGHGLHNNLWITDPEGKNFYQLTTVGSGQANLQPHFSGDGKRLVWSAKEGDDELDWVVKIADFVESPYPHLENTCSYQPAGHAWYETHGFSPDGSRVLCTIGSGTTAYADYDIFEMEIATQRLIQLTDTPDVWDEHAHYSPDGKTIVWISSQGYPYDPADWVHTLKTDLWMMNADGSNVRRITYLNEPGSSEYTGRQTIMAENSWSPSGDRIVAAVVYPAGGRSSAQDIVIDVGPFLTHPTWYLAEGSSDWGFDTYVNIENPNDETLTCAVTYQTRDGQRTRPDLALPPLSQTVINPRDDIGSTDFSALVECREGKTIGVDRRMIWTGTAAPSHEAHSSVGVTFPATTWYLPEGSSAWGFECWLLIQNPNLSEATARVTYMIEGEGPQTFEKKVPAGSRATFDMADDIGSKDASIKVEADMPVIPERAMYRNNRREGHDSIGTTAPATDYYLAEGCTAAGFTTFVLIQNPQDSSTDVTVTYMTPGGPKIQPAFTVPPNSRRTIRVNDVPGVGDTDISTRVQGSQPVIAERAMYWGGETDLGEACHDSIGMAEPHATFYLPDGETTGGSETWTLVQNPNDTDVDVEISYLTPDGNGNVVFRESLSANSRKTFNMADEGINGRAAVMVSSKTEGMKIMVERAMYWNNRGAGTDTIGGYSN